MDLANMKDYVGGSLFSSLKDLNMTKSEALAHVKRFFEHCKTGGFGPVLYYTGHGEVGTGNWCFKDGTVGIQGGYSIDAMWVFDLLFGL